MLSTHAFHSLSREYISSRASDCGQACAGRGWDKKKLAFGPFFKNVPVRAEDLSMKGL